MARGRKSSAPKGFAFGRGRGSRKNFKRISVKSTGGSTSSRSPHTGVSR